MPKLLEQIPNFDQPRCHVASLIFENTTDKKKQAISQVWFTQPVVQRTQAEMRTSTLSIFKREHKALETKEQNCLSSRLNLHKLLMARVFSLGSQLVFITLKKRGSPSTR